MHADGHPDIHNPCRRPPSPHGEEPSEEFCLHALDMAQQLVDDAPTVDLIHLRYFLSTILPHRYTEQIRQIRRRPSASAACSININAPGNVVAPGAHTAMLNDSYLQPPPAVDG